MSETELLLPDGLRSEKAIERMSGALDGLRVEAVDRQVRKVRRTFYDTFDGQLRKSGGCAVYEDGRLRFGALEASVSRAPERVLPSALDPGPLRDAVESLVDVRALLPLAELEVRERRLRVLDDERKTVVRATLEEPAVVGVEQGPIRLSRRLRLHAVRGYDASLQRIRRLLEHELGLRIAQMPLVEEAIAATGGAPQGETSKIDVPLTYEQPADAAAVAVLHALLDVIELNLEGTIEDLDSEFLHDLRVSVRRTRSVQRQLKGVFPHGELEHFRQEFRWLQGISGPARDLDVYLLGFDSLRHMIDERLRADLEPLREVLALHRRRARQEMIRGLRSKRFSRLLDEWAAFLDRLPTLPSSDREDAERPIGSLAGERIAKVYRRMVTMGVAIDVDNPPEDYHELRKKGKELRYLLQLIGANVYPDEVVGPMVKTLKSLQDVLGRHQDREVQMATVRSLSEEVAARPDGARALIAVGALLGALAEDERAAREEFAERFAAFGAKRQRTLVKDTFA